MKHFYEITFDAEYNYIHKIICTGSREFTDKTIKGLFPAGSVCCVRVCPDWVVYAYNHPYITI